MALSSDLITVGRCSGALGRQHLHWLTNADHGHGSVQARSEVQLFVEAVVLHVHGGKYTQPGGAS